MICGCLLTSAWNGGRLTKNVNKTVKFPRGQKFKRIRPLAKIAAATVFLLPPLVSNDNVAFIGWIRMLAATGSEGDEERRVAAECRGRRSRRGPLCQGWLLACLTRGQTCPPRQRRRQERRLAARKSDRRFPPADFCGCGRGRGRGSACLLRNEQKENKQTRPKRRKWRKRGDAHGATRRARGPNFFFASHSTAALGGL